MNAAQSLLGPDAITLASKLFIETCTEATGREFHTEGGIYPFDPTASHYGACIRLDYGSGTVQLAVFGTALSCDQIVRALYQFGPEQLLAPAMIVDALGETLNLLAGRLKQSVFDTSGLELHLGLPVRFVGSDVRNFATRAIPIRATRVAAAGLSERFEIVCADRSSDNLLREVLATLEGSVTYKPLLIRALGLCEELCEARREGGPDSELFQLGQCVDLIASVINDDAKSPRDAIERVRGCMHQLLQIHEVAQRITVASSAAPGEATPPDFPAFVQLADDDITRESVGELARDATGQLDEATTLLAALERGSKDDAQIERLFRIFRGLKGNASMWELDELGALAEGCERLLASVRDGTVAADERVLAALHRASALCFELLARIEQAVGGDGRVSSQPGVPELIVALAALHGPAESTQAPELQSPAARASETVRVEAASLDRLEKLCASFAGLQESLAAEAAAPQALLARFDALAASLEKVHAEMRKVPIGPLLTKLARMARDVSLKVEKAIRVSLSGEDSRVSRRVLESLSEPLEQLVRHALHQGLETPTERSHTSKPPLATLELEAHQSAEGGVTVALRDDGRGLDRKRVIAKATSLELLAPGAGSALSDAAVFDLIFAPGFSSAEQSGYRVGLDNVKRTIEQLGGRIEVESQFGKGCSIRIVIPPASELEPALGPGLPNGEQVDSDEITFF